LTSSKKFVFDVDGTICTATDGNYSEAKPFINRIQQINKLYDEGNTIVFLTARGMGSSSNNCQEARSKWEDLTRNQLKLWGVKFHELFMCKPAGDCYIDDKGINDQDFFV
jgi:phosphatidate phosphatase PAH1